MKKESSRIWIFTLETFMLRITGFPHNQWHMLYAAAVPACHPVGGTATVDLSLENLELHLCSLCGERTPYPSSLRTGVFLNSKSQLEALAGCHFDPILTILAVGELQLAVRAAALQEKTRNRPAL